MISQMFFKSILTIEKILFILLIVFFCFEAYTLYLRHVMPEKLPGYLGNFQYIRDRLTCKKQKDEFNFAVIGDTQSAGTFENIAKQLRKEPLSFAILLGDFVRKGTEGEHDYFISECVNEFKFPFPVFFCSRKS